MRRFSSHRFGPLARTLVGLLLSVHIAASADAIITMRDPGRNLFPPTGELAGSGWQYEGDWHGFTGTAIGPHSFITAVHVGGYPGAPFIYRGRTYRALDATIIPGSDICVWSVIGRFPAWAPMYEGNSEVAHDIVMFGRGTARGKPIKSIGGLRGWNWGRTDHLLSWGRSWVSATVDGDPSNTHYPVLGDALIAPFDADVGPDAGIPSGGDSGGGVFLKDDDGKWKLAGEIYGVRNFYLPATASNHGMPVAVYDGRGPYRVQANGLQSLLPTYLGDVGAGQTLISRTSTSLPAIRNAIVSRRQLRIFALTMFLLVVVPVVSVVLIVIYGLRRQNRLSVEGTAQ